MKHYKGVIPAAYTPFRRTGELDLGPVPDLAHLYRSQGLPAVFVCGSTGESHSLTVPERRLVAEAWSRETGMGIDLIVQIGCNSRVDAIELAGHAQSVGAAAVASFAPSYYRPETMDDLVEWLQPVAGAASDLPFYFYDIPEMTGVNFRMDLFMRMAADRIPNFAGLKYTSTDLMRLQTCLDLYDGRFSILFGIDEILLAALSLGVRGGVGSTYNYAAPLYRRLIDAFQNGDLAAARQEQRKSVQLAEALNAYGVLRAGKAIMRLIGIDCGPVRPPLRPVETGELAEIHRAVAHLDIFPSPLRFPPSRPDR